MTTQVTITNLEAGIPASIGDLVVLSHGQPMTTSRRVAERFNKLHKDVLKTIKKHLGNKSIAEFTERNFAPSEYTDPTGRKLTEYLMTKDGFSFLVGGFTGDAALHWRISFIAAFNALLERATTAPLTQTEKYWFNRRPIWRQIRPLTLDGYTYRQIGAQVGRSATSVGNSVRRMVQVGLIDPAQLFRAHYLPATAERLISTKQLCLDWGMPS